jgi:polar amino acid transport system substrate-binding protein
MSRRFAVLAAGVLVFGSAAAFVRADALSDIRQRGTLRWGADQEGGGPYVFPRRDDPTQVQGFEVELAELLARRLGVRAVFSQGPWDKLPDLLDRGDIDIVLNGYEWTENHARRYGTTIPYYLYELQLLGRRDDASLATLDDLRRAQGGRKKRVAVLGGSAAQSYLEQHFAEDVEIVSFDGNTDALRAVELATDGIDATLQDLPIVVFYERGFPALRRIGEPTGLGYYVILVRKGEKPLLAALNDAILAMLRDGSLRQVLERYHLWNATQSRRGLEADAEGGFVAAAEAPADVGDARAQTFVADRGWRVIQERTPLLLWAAGMTVKLAVLAMPLAILIGLGVAIARLYGPRLVARLLTLYVEVIRGTPLVLQLYVIFFLLPEFGLRIDAFWAAVLGLAVNYSAYEAEIYRAGLQAIPRGQLEAALALGMSRGLALRRVIVPQATRIVIPPVTNDFIALFKDTAVCSIITVVELSKEYYIHARSTGAIVELGIATALLYLAMSYPLSVLTNRLEQRLAGERRP